MQYRVRYDEALPGQEFFLSFIFTLLLPSERSFFPRPDAVSDFMVDFATFCDGIDAYLRLLPPSDDKASPEFLEEENWIRDDGDWWPYAFLSLCREFDIVPESLRAALKRRKEEHQRQAKVSE